MSSILDALNKGAAEKANARDEVVDPRAAAEEMVGAQPSRAITLTPRLIAATAGAALLLVALSVGLSAVLLRDEAPSASPPNQLEIARTVQDAPPTISSAVPTIPVEVRPDAAPAPPPSPAPKTGGAWRDVIASDPAPPPSASAEAPSAPSPEPAPAGSSGPPAPNVVQVPAKVESQIETRTQTPSEIPPPAMVDTGSSTTPLPTFEQMRAERLKARAVDSSDLPEDSKTAPEEQAPIAEGPSSGPTSDAPELSSDSLPEMGRATRERYDLVDLTINMTRPASATNPRAIAFINRFKVYEEERILTTRARLLKVFTDGVAIEIIGGDEKYFVPIGAPR